MKNIALYIFIIILLTGCSDNSVNTPSFTVNFLPQYSGLWQYQVVDSNMNTVDTVNMFIGHHNINYGFANYSVYFFNGKITWDSVMRNKKEIIDSAEILNNERNFSFSMIRPKVYSYFDFILNLPLKLNEQWIDKYSGDTFKVDKYIPDYQVLEKKYNVYSINRFGWYVEINFEYYVNNHTFFSDTVGIIRQELYYLESKHLIKKTFNLISKSNIL